MNNYRNHHLPFEVLYNEFPFIINDKLVLPGCGFFFSTTDNRCRIPVPVFQIGNLTGRSLVFTEIVLKLTEMKNDIRHEGASRIVVVDGLGDGDDADAFGFQVFFVQCINCSKYSENTNCARCLHNF